MDSRAVGTSLAVAQPDRGDVARRLLQVITTPAMPMELEGYASSKATDKDRMVMEKSLTCRVQPAYTVQRGAVVCGKGDSISKVEKAVALRTKHARPGSVKQCLGIPRARKNT